jgi:hypothetical protein
MDSMFDRQKTHFVIGSVSDKACLLFAPPDSDQWPGKNLRQAICYEIPASATKTLIRKIKTTPL